MKLHHSLLAAALLYSPAVMATDNTGVWNEMQVKKFCHHRATQENNDAALFERCMQRYMNQLGEDKHPGVETELDNADIELQKKAAEKAAEKALEKEAEKEVVTP